VRPRSARWTIEIHGPNNEDEARILLREFADIIRRLDARVGELEAQVDDGLCSRHQGVSTRRAGCQTCIVDTLTRERDALAHGMAIAKKMLGHVEGCAHVFEWECKPGCAALALARRRGEGTG
jgi:hypothetical protein